MDNTINNSHEAGSASGHWALTLGGSTGLDVADAIYLLSRKEAKSITGTVVKVDGGESLI